VTTRQKESGKVKEFQSGQRNVRGNCFRSTLLIGRNNFFCLLRSHIICRPTHTFELVPLSLVEINSLV